MRMVQLLLNGVMLLIQFFVKILTDLPQLLMDAVFCGLNVRIFLQILPDEPPSMADWSAF